MLGSFWEHTNQTGQAVFWLQILLGILKTAMYNIAQQNVKRIYI